MDLAVFLQELRCDPASLAGPVKQDFPITGQEIILRIWLAYECVNTARGVAEEEAFEPYFIRGLPDSSHIEPGPVKLRPLRLARKDSLLRLPAKQETAPDLADFKIETPQRCDLIRGKSAFPPAQTLDVITG
jgi:hypothetical protein